MKQSLARVVLATLLALSVSACGSDDQSDSSTGEDTTTTEVADLTGKALALDDLPAGWAEDNSDDDNDSDGPACLEPLDDAEGFENEEVGEAEVSYMEGSGIPTLEQNLVEVTDEAVATEAMDIISSVLDGCGEFEDTTDDGQTFEGQIGRVQLDPVEGADRQENFQLTATTDGVSVSAALLLLQQGPYINFIVWVDMGSFDPAAVDEVATTAMAKL